MSDTPVHATHPTVVARLKRAEGHLRRVIRMIESAEPCLDIAQQLHAVERAVVNAKRVLIHDHIDHCLDDEGAGDRSDMAEFRAIARYL